ncbi:flavodoxin domain-containing protein [Streptomyces mirabilis]
MSPKIAVIYYSSTGTVHELAESVAEGARKEGAEVRLLRVAELAPEEAITATATAHGGQESTLLALYNSVHHLGGIIVTPGYTDPVKFADGNPYGTSHVNGQGAIPVDDTARATAVYQGKRVAAVTARFKNA